MMLIEGNAYIHKLSKVCVFRAQVLTTEHNKKSSLQLCSQYWEYTVWYR